MKKEFLEKALEQGKGVLRLAPAWVPRSFCRPGKRIKLHPDDYYILGLERGAIDERWLSSTTKAENGPLTTPDEGLSYIVSDRKGEEKTLFLEAVQEYKGKIIGDKIWRKYGRWPMFSKFFDNLGPLPHHVHHDDGHAALVGASGKPEMYFFPSQLNNHNGEFAFTFFGLNPGTAKEELKQKLKKFPKGDNRILEISRAYKLALDTGWDVPPGVLHAPGSLCTYEPQFASDVYAMYQSVLYGEHCVVEALLWKNCPEEKIGNFDYLVDVVNWELNVDPDFEQNRFMEPVPVNELSHMEKEGYIEEWICYKCREVSAKRLTVLPGKSVRIKDSNAYGMIAVQGGGTINGMPLSSPTLIRYGSLTDDEFFIIHEAANQGVNITNLSDNEPLVILKHFAQNIDLEKAGL